MKAKPIIYGMTVPTNAPDPSLGESSSRSCSARGPGDHARQRVRGPLAGARQRQSAVPASIRPLTTELASAEPSGDGASAPRAAGRPRSSEGFRWSCGCSAGCCSLSSAAAGAADSQLLTGQPAHRGRRREVRDAILLSLKDAAITAGIATVFGVPLAYLLARRPSAARPWSRRSSTCRLRCRTPSPGSRCCSCSDALAGSAHPPATSGSPSTGRSGGSWPRCCS